jgi:hypothetical protein
LPAISILGSNVPVSREKGANQKLSGEIIAIEE